MLDCTSALVRDCRLHTLYLLMAARQTSIISATAPPAPAFVTNVEVDLVVSTIPVAFTVPLTITSSLALSAHVSSQVSPRKFHFARVIHNTANRLVTVKTPSLLTRSDLASLSGILVPRATAFQKALFLALLQIFPHHERSRLFCVSGSSTSWESEELLLTLLHTLERIVEVFGDKTGTIHTVSTKNNTLLMSLKQSSKTSRAVTK